MGSADGHGAAPDALLGRDGELRQLREGLATAAAGGTVLAELVGEPGMGKTRLVHALRRLAADAGHQVVSASCAQMLADVPYAALTPLLRALGVRLTDAGQPDGALTRYALARLVRDAFATLAPGPMLVSVDDAHWADPASLDLLGGLLHDPPDRGLLVCVAHRTRQGPPELASALAVRSAGTTHVRLVLGPLSTAEVGELVGLDAGPRLDALHGSSGGNPLYAQALAADGAPEPGTRGDGDDAAEQALRAEFAGLTAAQREMLQIAAVAGDRFDADLPLAVASAPPDEAGAALDTLVARDLLRGAGSQLRFRHAVLQTLAYREVPTSTRRHLHERLGSELARRGSTAPVLAVHVLRSARPGDLPAVRLLVDSVAQIGAREPRVAIEYLRTARSLLGTGGDPDLRTRIDIDLARAHVAGGALAEARDVLHAHDPTGVEPATRVRHALVRARVDRLLGHHQEALAVLRAELDHTGPDAPESIVLLALEGAMCAALGGSELAGQLVSQAEKTVCELADPAFLPAVQISRAFITSMRGGPEPTDLAAAAQALDALPDSHLVHLLDPFGLLGWAELQLEQDRAALRHFERGIGIANRSGHADLLPFLLIGRSYSSSRLGLFGQGSEAARDAVAAARALGGDSTVALAMTFQASADTYVSGPEATRAVADAAVYAAPPESRDWFAEIGRRVAARIRYASGDPDGGMAALVRACGGVDMDWVEVCNRPYWCSVLAEMSMAAGRDDDAADWIDRATEHAGRLGLRGATAHVDLARARFLARQGDVPAALAAASSAVAGLAALSWVADEIFGRLLVANLHAALGDWAPMSVELAEARRLVEATSGQWLRGTVIAEQRHLHTRAGSHRDGEPSARSPLSRREREIAALVTAGATNVDIARTLHVTVKTVEAHLSRVYRKLGIRSRTMLATALPPEPTED